MTINFDPFVTYMATATQNTPATPTDVFSITGSATSNIYINKIAIATSQSTAGDNRWFLVKRSTANTTGTAATMVPMQSGFSAASALVQSYTSNPTTGNLVGNIWGGNLYSINVGSSGENAKVFVLDLNDLLGNPIALLSANEVLAWNFNGAANPSGLRFRAWVMWSESSKT